MDKSPRSVAERTTYNRFPPSHRHSTRTGPREAPMCFAGRRRTTRAGAVSLREHVEGASEEVCLSRSLVDDRFGGESWEAQSWTSDVGRRTTIKGTRVRLAHEAGVLFWDIVCNTPASHPDTDPSQVPHHSFEASTLRCSFVQLT